MRANRFLFSVLLLAAVSACHTDISAKRIDYQATKTLPPLEIPPGLSSLPPNAQGSTPSTYSGFEAQQKRTSGTPQSSGLLPQFSDVRLERAGAQRWLVVKATPEQVWPQVVEFLNSAGLTIARQEPQAGIVETDWAENRANVGSSVQKFFSKITGHGLGTGQRDKYRIRLERGEEPGTTEIYLTHRGMVEVVVDSGTSNNAFTGRELGGSTAWQPRPPDPELEAEMMKLLLVHLGTSQMQAQAVLQEKTAPRATFSRANGDTPALTLSDQLPEAWQRVGISLDNIGYVVEDEDHSNWVYFVRDTTADETQKRKKKKKSTEVDGRYQVALQQTDNGTAVRILSSDGKPESAKESEKILSLLYERLK